MLIVCHFVQKERIAMKKTKTYTFPSINFRKFWGYPCTIKNCDVELEVQAFINNNGHLVFHVNTKIWNPTHKQTFIDGDGLELLQNFQDIATNKTYQILLSLYQKYQHREIHFGSPQQEQLLHAAIAAGDLPPREPIGSNSYREYLASCNMYFTSWNGMNYEFGHGWLNGEPIPKRDSEMIITLTS